MLDLESLESKYWQFKYDAEQLSFFVQGFRETFSGVRGFYLVRPKSRSYQEPGELCFVYELPEKEQIKGNRYKVVICTTKRVKGFVGKDAGWVLILNEDGEKVYSSGPFIRTNPDFFEDLLREARVARWRVFYRPLHCGKFQKLVRGRYLKQRFWRCAVCPKDKTHNSRFDDLRKPLPPEEMEKRIAKRKERRKRRAKVRAEGKDPHAQFKKRMEHPWVKRESLPPEITF